MIILLLVVFLTAGAQLIKMNGVPSFQEFLADLLGCFIKDPQMVAAIKERLCAILSNLKTQATQGVDMYVSKHLIPELSRLIQSSCGVSAEKQLMSLKPFIVIGLDTFLQNGRVLNKDEITQLAKNTLPGLIIETLAFPDASESTKKTVAKIVAASTNMFFDTGLSPTQSYEDFVKDLKDSLCEAVLPELKEQLMSAMDRSVLDYVENAPDIKYNATSFMNLLIPLLTSYGLPTEFLQCLESTFEDTLKTLKLSPRKIIKKTVKRTADRVTSKIQEASLNDLHHFVDFLTELLRCFFNDLVDVLETELRAILSNMKTQAKQGVDRYVSKHLIPDLSRLIQYSFGVSAEKQLMSLKPFIIKGLKTFLKKGRVLNKDEIIQNAKKSIPELIIEMAIPNANENTKTLVCKTLNLVQEAVFNLRPGTTPPSVEKLLQTLLENCADKVFCIDRSTLSQAIDKLIELMPENVDKIMEFLMKHVLPALSVCFEATAFVLVAVFLNECFVGIRKEGTVRVRGRDLAKPLAMKALNLASKKVIKNAAEVSTVVTETVVKRKVTHKLVEKCVVDKAGGKVAVETTKKMAAKTSKSVVAKVTQNASTKVVSTASQVTAKQSSVKVGTKAVQSISGKASHQGVQVAGKTVQKTSVKMTKNSITNGVKEVTKKSVKKTVKTTLSETAESVTVTTTKKVTKTSVSKTTNICQTSSKAAAEVGMKNAAKAGVTAAGLSAVVGGVFLYRDLKDLDKKKKEGSLSEKEYKEQKVERIGEYAGDVIGSGVVAAAVSVAALTGPVGWAAIGAGAIVSYGTGKLGGRIAKALA